MCYSTYTLKIAQNFILSLSVLNSSLSWFIGSLSSFPPSFSVNGYSHFFASGAAEAETFVNHLTLFET